MQFPPETQGHSDNFTPYVHRFLSSPPTIITHPRFHSCGKPVSSSLKPTSSKSSCPLLYPGNRNEGGNLSLPACPPNMKNPGDLPEAPTSTQL